MHDFQKTVWDYYHAHGRTLPWRCPEPNGQFVAYKILVSEVMLQQTQVPRVIAKYRQFITRFPSIDLLAKAPLAEVIRVWNGLGYNRRAKFLHAAAKELCFKTQPWTLDDLTSCKGIGPNTAGAVLAYAYNQPAVFIETNIRTVYIHHFFTIAALPDKPVRISDAQILELVEQTLDPAHPREWYWALMDYGTHLKTTVGNLAQASAVYTKQSTFEGSKRQIRGQVLHLLTKKALNLQEIVAHIPDSRVDRVLGELMTEGFIVHSQNVYRLAR